MLNSFSKWLKETSNAPNIMYHGTLKKFDKLDMAYTRGQMGIHFGTWEQAMFMISDAQDSPAKGSRIIAAHIFVNNPLPLKDLGSWYGENVVKMVNDALGSKLNPSAGDDILRREIIRKGYDSVIYNNEIEGSGTSYIVFNTNQIKVIEVKEFNEHVSTHI